MFLRNIRGLITITLLIFLPTLGFGADEFNNDCRAKLDKMRARCKSVESKMLGNNGKVSRFTGSECYGGKIEMTLTVTKGKTFGSLQRCSVKTKSNVNNSCRISSTSSSGAKFTKDCNSDEKKLSDVAGNEATCKKQGGSYACKSNGNKFDLTQDQFNDLMSGKRLIGESNEEISSPIEPALPAADPAAPISI